MKILITIGLMVAAVPATGILLGLSIGRQAKALVYPVVLISWGVIIYVMWFR